jgi:uncharacterized protein YecT (DUF1311 family)
MIALAILASVALNCKDPSSQAEMTQCAAQEFRGEDAALNKQWAVTSRKMKDYDKDRDANSYDKRPGYYAALLAAQQAWLKFRDAHCVSTGYVMRGGSAEPMMVNGCLATLTRARTKQLRELAEGFE